MCAASLMKGGLSLPSSTGLSIFKQKCVDCNWHITWHNCVSCIGDDGEVDVDLMEDVARRVSTMNSSWLGKGLQVSLRPTVHEALEGNLPYRSVQNFGFFKLRNSKR